MCSMRNYQYYILCLMIIKLGYYVWYTALMIEFVSGRLLTICVIVIMYVDFSLMRPGLWGHYTMLVVTLRAGLHSTCTRGKNVINL